MTARPSTIFWDSDGTLVNTEAIKYDATRAVLEELGCSLTRQQYIDAALTRGVSVLEAVCGATMSSAMLVELKQRRDRKFAELLGRREVVVPGAQHALESLRHRFRMYLVTGSTRRDLTRIYARNGLLSYFDAVITRDDCVQVKPHPEPYLNALRLSGCAASACVAIEDSPSGIDAAVQAGVCCYGLYSGFTHDVLELRAEKTFADPRQVAEYLLTSNGS